MALRGYLLDTGEKIREATSKQLSKKSSCSEHRSQWGKVYIVPLLQRKSEGSSMFWYFQNPHLEIPWLEHVRLLLSIINLWYALHLFHLFCSILWSKALAIQYVKAQMTDKCRTSGFSGWTKEQVKTKSKHWLTVEVPTPDPGGGLKNQLLYCGSCSCHSFVTIGMLLTFLLPGIESGPLYHEVKNLSTGPPIPPMTPDFGKILHQAPPRGFIGFITEFDGCIVGNASCLVWELVWQALHSEPVSEYVVV